MVYSPRQRRELLAQHVKRLESVEQANGIGDKQPKKGISHRLDAIEETQEEILARLDKTRIGLTPSLLPDSQLA